jgi:colanic acid biosynthesis glycosyl transferase WcaI
VTDLSGVSVCVVACHYRPESTGSAPLTAMLIDTVIEAGGAVDVVAGVPHYPHWRVQDARYRWGLHWRERDGLANLTRVRHAVPRQSGPWGRLRIESSFAVLSAPFVRLSSANVVIAVTPLVGAMMAALAGRRGRPFGVVVHDLSGSGAEQSGTAGPSVARLVGAAEYRMLARATKVGVITPRFAPILAAHGVVADRITPLPIFPHVVRSDLTREQARRRLGWDERIMTVVHTGNMGMKQGLEHLLTAARLADRSEAGVRFGLVGDGNQRHALQACAAGLRNVQFIPPVSEEDYPVVLAAADVLLLHERPGLTVMSLPSKLTSYVTARRPILAAVEDGGSTKALLDTHGAAVTTPSGDAKALLAGLDRLRNDPDLVAEVVAGAQRMRAAEFGRQRATACVTQFVHELALAGTSRRKAQRSR